MLCHVAINAGSAKDITSSNNFIWDARFWSHIKKQTGGLDCSLVCFVKWSLTWFHTFCFYHRLIHLIAFSLACRNKDFPTDKHTHTHTSGLCSGWTIVKWKHFYTLINLPSMLLIWFEETTFFHGCSLILKILLCPVGMCVCVCQRWWWQTTGELPRGLVLPVNPCGGSGHFASSVNCSRAVQQQGSFYPFSPAPDNIVLTRPQHDRSASVADYKALFQTLVHGIKWMKRAQRG